MPISFTRYVLLLVCLLTLPALKSMGVTANFTADYVSGCAPLVVHFTNTSSGATSYSWDLGNGTTTAFTDAAGTYVAAGTYTVTLTAYSGSSSSVHTLIITVYPTPVVSFYADDTAVCPGTTITFTSTSTAGVTGPLTYMWNFGDGGSSTASGPSHPFNSSGYYNITLSATNSQGCVSSLTKTAYIHVFNPPVANFNVNSTYFCNAPAHAIFTNITSGPAPLTCQWYFGDGGSSTDVSPTHDYTTTGAFTVKLVVTDADGCKDSTTRTAFINVGSITAAFTNPTTACVFSAVHFTNTSSAHISNNWNFGDGGTDTANSPYHTYSSAGTYTVSLVIFDGTCYDTITHTITILPEPTGSFTVAPLQPCPAPTTLTFTPTVPGGGAISWVYGDGSSGTSLSHTYSSNGEKDIKMVITDGSGCKDTVTQPFDIYNLLVNINHDTIPTGCVPLTVTFNCYAWTTVPDPTSYLPYPFGVASYTWNFGDGSAPVTSATCPVFHTYTAVGTYTATVHVVTNNGCTADYSIQVLVGTPPVAAFTAAPTHLCADRPVTFTNTSTGADSYFWMFGDGTTSYGTSPVDTYKIPGVYTVTLIAFYHGCPDTFIRTNYITVDSPFAVIRDSIICSPDTRVYFGDSSYGDDTHVWIFSDGFTTAADNPVHDFPTTSTYTVLLATYNAASGCRDTAHVNIDLTQPVISFSADDTAICRDGYVHFTPVVTGGTVITYNWFVNGLFVDDTTVVFTDTFHTTGIYSIKLVTVNDKGCLDTILRNNYILVARPVDSFTVAPPTGCWPLAATFTDHSTDVAGTYFTNFNWTFGDGATASVSTLSTMHTYTDVGTFNVREIVTDNIGCKDTIFKPSDVTVYRPHAAFYASTVYPCPWATDYFVNTSTDAVSSYWLFGDGGTSPATSPSHVYTATGNYTVKLVVTDAHGCTDTATSLNYIHVTKPDASFYMSDSVAVCPPLSVSFFNTTTGATSYYWTFGDGNTSTAPSPGNLYISSGLYNVSLIAYNAYGCADTAIGHVNLFGYAGAFTYTPDTGCAPLTVHFNASISNVPSIVWDFADGTVSSPSTVDSTVHTYSIPGAYVPKLILSDNTGCQNSSVGLDTIKVDAVKPGIGTTPACVGSTFNFIDSSTSYWSTIDSWQWSYAGTTSTLSSPSYVYNTAGTYTVSLKASDAWGCSAFVSATVTVYPPPVITASPDTIICLGDAATLTGYGGVSYTWGPASSVACTTCNPASATPAVITTYTVTGTDANGCSNTDTVTVYLKTKTVSNAWGDTAVCQGIPVPLYDTGGTTYVWIPASGLNSSSIYDPMATPGGTTTYTVVAQLGSCIPDTNYVTVKIFPLPTVNAGPDQTLLAGSTAQLNATGTDVAIYYWEDPVPSLSCDTCENPVASMSVTTTYTVVGVSPLGCKRSDSVTIHLYCDNSQVFIPNTFTPNGDGENDVFYPRGTGVSKIKSFRIYNRWGELLFERSNIDINDASNAWDGTYKGATPRADVYVYIVDAICDTGEPINLKGDVTIIR